MNHVPLCLFILASSLPAQAVTPTTQRLTLLRSAYEAAYQKEVATVHSTALADLDAKYTAALDRALAAATQAGQLDTALALRDEKKRLADAAPLPADDFAAPETLKTLRLTYRSALANLELRRDQTAAPVKAKYDAALEALQTELTRAADLDGAVAVKTLREGLKTAAIPAAIAPATPTSQPSPAVGEKPVAAKSNGKTDPKAAEQVITWALANKAVITTNLGKIGSQEAIKTLPKGKLSIESVTMTVEAPGFPWEALAGLGELKVLVLLNPEPVTSTEAKFFSSLANLEVLEIRQLTQEGANTLPSLPKLRKLFPSYNSKLSSVVPILVQRCPNITELTLRGDESPEATEAMYTHLSGWKQLTEFYASVSLTPALAGKLAPMASLQKIMLFTGSKIETGCMSLLPQLKVVHLNGPHPPSILAEIVALPQLSDLSIDIEGLPLADLPDLKQAKNLKFLSVDNSPSPTVEVTKRCAELRQLSQLRLTTCDLSDADLESLLEMKQLESLILFRTKITDAGLMKLKTLKKLGELGLTDTQVTEKGVGDMKKALPKCRIIR